MTGEPEAIVSIAIEPQAPADRARLEAALAAFAAEDPALRVAIDRQSGQIMLGGASELHLDRVVDRFRREDGIAVNVGAPQVAYRETLTKRIEMDYTHKTRAGGTGRFARVKIVFEPNEPETGSTYESEIVGDAVPRDCMAGVEKGIGSVMGAGVLAGFPVVDVRVTLVDGAYHEVDSSASAFEIAARSAFREALGQAGVLLEPVMNVEVTTPEDFAGFVSDDLAGRRGELQNRCRRGDAVVIAATVPLANIFGYANQLRSGTQGRASFEMNVACYRPVDPPSSPPRFPPAAARRVA